ncbi:MAG: hypothetical protein ACYDAR_09915 [Thermomicrobiales bacterium]
MTTQPTQEPNEGRQMVKRRGLIAGAATLVVGMLAKQATQTVEAAYVLQGDTTNGATTTTAISGPVSGAAILLLQNGSTGPGSAAISDMGDGLQGFATSGASAHGVYGYAGGASAIAVRGEAFNTAMYGTGGTSGVIGTASAFNGNGIYGFAGGGNGIGVLGDTLSTYGVFGQSEMAGGVGVAGNCVGGFGVLGRVTDGFAVAGEANGGIGVYGSSSQKHGVYGLTSGAYQAGVFGITNTTNATGVYGSTYNAGTATNTTTAFAGFMDGNFAVVHGTKSAAVPFPDGSYHLMYCVESPDNWFEDFGQGKLVGGKATVKLDADFASVVHTNDYAVFLTEQESHQHLTVTARTPTEFTVEADAAIAAWKGIKASDVSGTFAWRLVAKRKDLKVERLAKVSLPTKQGIQATHAARSASLPKLPAIPKLPQLPSVPRPAVKKP